MESSSSKDKGDQLEAAVRAIETAILRTSPNYSEQTFHIDSKKVVTAGGVRHEVDIWVGVSLGKGYDACFIFECKNWQQKVSKNEIIVFSEKIRALGAQRGFFVARSFTRDAQAQAGQDPRIELLHVEQLPSDGVPAPLGLHGISVLNTETEVMLEFRGEPDPEAKKGEPIDLDSVRLLIDGQHVHAGRYVDDLTAAERDSCIARFPSGNEPTTGVHSLTFKAQRGFASGQATLNNKDLAEICVRGTVNVEVTRPRIISSFDVARRGRAVKLALEYPDGTLHATFIEIPADPKSEEREGL